jgi:hypothetical protein
VPLLVRARAGARAPVERWARGAYGLLTGGQDFGELGREEAQGLLESPWGVEDARALHSTIEALEAADSDELAWDLIRVILLARLGAAAGYLDAATSWAVVSRVGARLQTHYPDWDALGRAYARGRGTWLTARGIDEPSNHALVERNMQVLTRQVWARVEYRTPLG